jgi:hypothetical protein
MVRSPGRVAAALGTVAALAAIPAPSAVATNVMGHRMPDGTPTYIMRTNLTAGFQNAVETVRQSEFNPTDLTTLYTSTLSQAYLQVVDGDYGNIGWAGLWTCGNWGSGNICRRADIYLNLDSSAPPGGTYDATERRSLVCEEMGHGVGLAHRYVNAGCMSQNWGRIHWTDHDKNHVNNWY